MLEAAFATGKIGHDHARRIIRREHFKIVYERNPIDVRVNPEAGKAVFDALTSQFGSENFRHDRYQQGGGPPDFPVRMRDGQAVSSLEISTTLNRVPVVSIDYVFANRSVAEVAGAWLKGHKSEVIKPKEEGTENG